MISMCYYTVTIYIYYTPSIISLAQSTHWVYNDSVMQKVTATNGPEFVSPSPNPFYSLPVGSQSFYGDQTLVLLKSLAKCKGTYIL